MWGTLRNGLGAVLDLVLPQPCAACGVCGQPADPLCQLCAQRLLELVGQPYCLRCGSSLASDPPSPSQPPGPAGYSHYNEDGCPHCPTPMPRFDRLVRLAPYVDPLAAVIRDFKFRGLHRARRWLGRMLAQKVLADRQFASVQVIQPMPLYWLRHLRRGYNQADIIARALADELNLPTVHELSRVRDTPPQVGLPRRQRIANVRGAFDVPRPRKIVGQHVLLVDDVTTTGATAGEAAHALLLAGAGRVSLAVLAKSDPPTRSRPPRQA